MPDDKQVEKELRQLRTQGKVEVIILVSSLVLIFLWMSFLSISFELPTFSGDVYRAASNTMGMPAAMTLNFSLLFAILFTCFFCLLLWVATVKLKR